MFTSHAGLPQSGQGKTSGKYTFSRSGKSQGISFSVRENEKKVMEIQNISKILLVNFIMPPHNNAWGIKCYPCLYVHLSVCTSHPTMFALKVE